jgi:hypothetical protein
MPKKAPRKKQNGKGIKEILGAVHNIVKDNRLISKGLTATGLAPLGAVANLLGYGKAPRKRKAAPKRRMVGRGQVGTGFFSDLGGGIGNVFGGLGGGLGSVAHGLFGGARGRPTTAGRQSVIAI